MTPALLAQLLAEWRHTKDPETAELIDALSEKLASK